MGSRRAQTHVSYQMYRIALAVRQPSGTGSVIVSCPAGQRCLFVFDFPHVCPESVLDKWASLILD